MMRISIYFPPLVCFICYFKSPRNFGIVPFSLEGRIFFFFDMMEVKRLRYCLLPLEVSNITGRECKTPGGRIAPRLTGRMLDLALAHPLPPPSWKGGGEEKYLPLPARNTMLFALASSFVLSPYITEKEDTWMEFTDSPFATSSFLSPSAV